MPRQEWTVKSRNWGKRASSLDEDDLRETVRVAVDDHEERVKKAAAGLERFRTHYASEVVAARLLGILDQAAA